MVQSDYSNISKTVKLASHIYEACRECGAAPTPVEEHALDEAINHYVEKHAYRLLHVGEETAEGDGEPFITTPLPCLAANNPTHR